MDGPGWLSLFTLNPLSADLIVPVALVLSLVQLSLTGLVTDGWIWLSLFPLKHFVGRSSK